MNFGYDENDNPGLDNPGGENGGAGANQDKTDLGGGGQKYDANGNPITDLGDSNKGNGDGNDGGDKDHNGNGDGGGNNGGENEIELNAGEVIQIGDDEYTVAENGDLLDKDGKVFKEAKDVKDFLKDYQDEGDEENKDKNKGNDDNKIDIKTIQEALGYQIVDDDDKEIEYENTTEGITAYVNDVMEQKTSEIQEATLNTLFEKYPFAKDMINYYIANGNSLDGWNENADRSNITIDDNDEKQQEDIVRTAWKEQKRTGDVESYIAYLKSAGILLSTAKSELAGLQQADRERQEETERQAAAAHQKQEEENAKFWKNVSDTIKSRTLGKYKLPEQIKVQRGGKTLMVTPDDFYRYLSVTDKDGETAYAKDCKAVSQEQQLNDSLLKAYIMFTGGDYSSLVDMAIKEKEVRTLRLKAKEGKQPSRKLTPKGNGNKTDKTPDLGY